MSESPIILKRLTTEYIEQEDRIRLSGESDNGRLVIWLTQRLAQRLVPLLLQWLEQHSTSRQAAALFSFDQQKVQATNLVPEVAFDWLISSIDITTNKEQAGLTFKSEAGHAATITFDASHLQRWLDIVRDTYIQAEWPQDAWPAWISNSAPVLRGEQAVVWQ